MADTTDRELLEAAAKAAGHMDPGTTWHGPWALLVGGRHWNPLTDSASALELAVKLRQMHIHIDAESTSAFRNDIHGMPAGFSGEPHGADPLAATRRAIVRLAAKLGGFNG